MSNFWFTFLFPKCAELYDGSESKKLAIRFSFFSFSKFVQIVIYFLSLRFFFVCKMKLTFPKLLPKYFFLKGPFTKKYWIDWGIDSMLTDTIQWRVFSWAAKKSESIILIFCLDIYKKLIGNPISVFFYLLAFTAL